MKTIKYIICVAILCLNACSQGNQKPAKTHKPSIEEIKKYQFTLSLPVNATLAEGKRVHLNVSIPKEYEHVGNKFDAPIHEFIPQGEQVANWSEIIVTQAFVGKKIPAQHFAEEVKKGMVAQASHAKVIHHSHKDHGTYSTATLTMKYTFKGRTEVMEAYYVSGPYDCSDVQYSIALSDKMTEHKALEKIKAFMKNHVSIQHF